MVDRPPADDADDLRQSLEDLGARIEAARAAPAPTGGRRGVAWLVGAFVVLAVAVIAGVLAVAGDDDGDVAADRGAATSGVGAAATVTAAPTTDAPTTTAAPPTTEPPTTATTEAPPTATTEAPLPPEPSETEEPVPVPATSRAEVTVEPGDSFWTIAEDEAARRLGRAPTLVEVTRLWADILDANVDRLVQRGNPDLILPGQVMVLPGAAATP